MSLASLRHALPVALLALAGCGGGGDPAPKPANRPPAFTSPSTTSISENSSGTIYAAAASDPDGDALSFSLSGGPDRAAFRITAAGALSFVDNPDFELPGDADRDNVYQIEIEVSDGRASTTLSLGITVTNAGNDAFRVRRVASGLPGALFVAAVPDGTGRIFVVQQSGRIRIVDPASGTIAPEPFLDVSGELSTTGEDGLLGFATAPDFATTGIFYIYMTNRAGNNEIRRYASSSTSRDRADPASGDVILAIPHPGFSNHNGGWLGFGPDNMLYVATGDGGGAGDPAGNAQNPDVLLGKILRIDVRSDAFPADAGRDYAIPTDNPFASAGGAAEVWALGLRNPFRNSFDPASGLLLIGDVGQASIEEINLMRPSDGGANFGWNLREGTQPFNGGANTPALVAPVAEYRHGAGATQGGSITGGRVYRGAIEGLRGQYIFGDFVNGRIWSLPISSLIPGQTVEADRFTIPRFTPASGTIDNVSSFGADQSDNLYIVDFDGEIFVIEPA